MEYSELSDSVRQLRETKKQFREYEIDPSGRPSVENQQIIDNANFVLSGLEDQYEHFITEKFTQLAPYLGVSYDEVREIHARGFNRYLRLQYKLFKKEQPEEARKLFEDSFIADLASGYTFDFLRTLNLAKRMDVGPRTALRLAEQACWNNPNLLIALSAKFPDVSPSHIINAASKNPIDPEAAIRRMLDVKSDLQAEFPEAHLELINQAAFYHRHTKARDYVVKVLTSIEGLKKQFPEADEGLIARAAMHGSKDPESFLENGLNQKKVLHAKYPTLGSKIIGQAVQSGNPQAFIEKYQIQLERLKSKYPDVDLTLINTALYTTLSKPDALVERFVTMIGNLQSAFPDVNKSIITMAVVNNRSGPEIALQDIKSNYEALQIKYPHLANELLLCAVTQKAQEHDIFIEDFLNKERDLQLKYPNIRKSVIRRATLTRSNPDGYLVSYEKRLHKLVDEFGDRMPMGMLKHAATYIDSSTALRKLLVRKRGSGLDDQEKDEEVDVDDLDDDKDLFDVER